MAAALVAGCGGPDTTADNPFGQSRLTLSGSSTVAPLVNEIARAFEARHPAVRVDVQTGGSSRGIADVRRGSVDIGMISRALLPEDEPLAAHTIAMDGVAMIIHADNPVPALTNAEIIDIYSGRIRNWSVVGGRDAPITVVNKADGRSTLDVFVSHFALPRDAIRADVVVGENLHGIRTVVGDPHAIGYVSIGTAEFERSNGTPIRLLSLDGIEASTANVRNGTFPLARPLNLVTIGEPTPLVEAFLAFASSREVNALIEKQFFVPIAD